MKESCRRKALKYLLEEKSKLTKLSSINYTGPLEIQNYLKSKDMTVRRKKLTFRLRTRLTMVGYNVGLKVMCPLCHIHEDNQEGILECFVLKLTCPELYQSKEEVYEDLFSTDTAKINKITSIFQACLNKREEMLQRTSGKGFLLGELRVATSGGVQLKYTTAVPAETGVGTVTGLG